MRRVLGLATTLVLLVAALPAGPAGAAGEPLVATAGPRSAQIAEQIRLTAGQFGQPAPLTFYPNPVLAVPVGADLTFANVDSNTHDLTHDVAADGGVGRPENDAFWCVDEETGDPLYPEGECPLFWSRTIGIGATPVEGLGDLEGGQVYSFFCRVHPQMKGKLVTLPEV